MIHEQDYHGLLRRSLLALAGCLAVVVVCYFWIDRPTAFYVHDHEIEKIRVFKWLTYPPPTIQTWSPLVLALLMVRRAFGTFSRWQELLVVACLSHFARRSLWPILAGNLVPQYPVTSRRRHIRFSSIQSGRRHRQFPVRPRCANLRLCQCWWIAMPRYRVIWIAVCLPMLVSLIAMNYHFVSDVVAGSALGGIVGAYAVSLANLQACQR